MYKKLLLGCSALSLAASVSAFDIQTKIYPAGTKTQLRFKAVSKWAKENINKITLSYMRMDRRHLDGKKYRFTAHAERVPFKVENQEVVIDVTLLGNSKQHTFSFVAPKKKGQKRAESRSVILLTLDEKTFKLRPFKGNVHQHSKHSDGRYTPEEHVAYARIAGFDYTSITDHGKVTQNPLAIKFAADVKSGLQVYYGEEIHSPGGILHGLAIGGKRQYSESRTPGMAKRVKPIWDKLIAQYPGEDEEELRCIAEGVYIARKARKDGALVVFCHPGWVVANRLNVTTLFTQHVLNNRDFDVMEVVNGSVYNCSNYIIWAQLYENAVKTGRLWPVMSSSDCHNVSAPGFRRNYNVIFAEDCTFPAFKSAFLDHRAIAVYETDAVAGKRRVLAPLFFGDSAYMAYAEYLHKIRFWPRHDAIAARQGRLILQYLQGDRTLIPKIAAAAKELEAYRESLYYRPETKK